MYHYQWYSTFTMRPLFSQICKCQICYSLLSFSLSPCSSTSTKQRIRTSCVWTVVIVVESRIELQRSPKPQTNINEKLLLRCSRKSIKLFTNSRPSYHPDMPKVRRSRKAPPEGWELIEPTLEELEQKMREGEFCICFMYYFCLED